MDEKYFEVKWHHLFLVADNVYTQIELIKKIYIDGCKAQAVADRKVIKRTSRLFYGELSAAEIKEV